MRTDEAGNDRSSRLSWFALGSIAACVFTSVTTEFIPIGLLGPIARDMGVSEGQGGLLVSMPGLMAAVSAPVATVAVRNADRRIVLLGLSLLLVAANLVAALAPNFAVLLLGRMLLGLCVGGVWTFGVAAGRRLVAEQDGGRATSVILAGISAGTVVGLPLGTSVGGWAGWRSVFWLTAVLAGLVAAAQALLLPRLPGQSAITVGRLVSYLRIRAGRAGLLAAALIAAGHFAAYTFIEPFLTEAVRVPGTWTSFILAAYGVAGVAGTFGGEWASRRSLRASYAAATIIVDSSVLGASLGRSAPGLAIAAILIWGIAFGAIPVCIQEGIASVVM